ncbi:polysaccharide biosynthesis tyrosine autokinase [Bradyrhizobium erythrophlei]|uniref:polysaccharide biosynthesis tyrosine autokinase n=1 Tax=Bradyrhizobium erythrophlei TaxID=1437360 RepID=UPI0035EB66EE
MDMLPRRTRIDYGAGREEATTSMSALIDQLTGLARRQYWVFLIVPAVAIAIGLLYLLATPSQYTATATLLIDSSTLRVLQNQLQPQGDIPLDTLQVGSQVEILASRKLGATVVKDLNLADDPEFAGTGGWSPLSRLAPGSPDERQQRALDEFLAHRTITRGEKTYALNIAYTSRSPVTAAKVANAIAEAYIDDQLGAKYQTITRAGAWLQDRINELKSKATAADRSVLEFKEKNNIVDLGGASTTAGPGAASRLIGEQQLFELNSQLATARGATSEAKARLDRIEQVRKMDVSEGAVADTLKNDVITRLRNQFLDLSAREANIAARYGADHAAAVNLRDQMAEVRRNIGAELGRIAGSYRSDYEIAKTREENLERSLAGLVSEGQLTNRDRLGLAELESSAKVYRTLYDSFLQRYMEAIQQQSFPITDARVISPAVPPARKSKPVASFVLAIALTMGLMASFGIAALREAVDAVFRTARQAEQELGTRCLSVIPLATGPAIPAPSLPRSRAAKPAEQARLPAAAPQQRGDQVPADGSRYTFSDPLKRRAVDDPISVFTEAFRAIKVSAWLQATIRETKVIGITSTLANEGKSTVASNLAALIADAGRRVVLIDADLRNPTLARSLTPRPATGWLDVLSGKVELAQATGREPTTGLALLPLLLTEAPVHSDEVLASSGFRDLLDRLRRTYDYVIVDLPPIAPVVDVRAIVPVIDSFVFVVEWGSTRIKTVRRHLLAEPELHDRLLGVVLNKADLRMLERFEQPGVYQNGYYMNGGYRAP